MVTLNLAKTFKRTDFIFDRVSGKIFHFGYISGTGFIICYTPGEENGQDAVAFSPDECFLVQSERQDLLDLANRR